MLFKILLKYLQGYVRIRIEGYFTEKFITKCIKEGIVIWNIKREKSTIIYTNIGIKDFKKLNKIAKSTKCKLKIVKKRGFPFVVYKYKKRKVFITLLIILIVSSVTLSQFIWKVDIVGIEKIDKTELEEFLKEKGVKVGSIKGKIDTQKIINEVRLKRDDISWIGISIKGTKAEIKVVEAKSKPEIVNEDDYCNIVADKNAQIVKISAKNGIPKVTAGMMVSKGDVLIAGWIEGKYTGTRFLHAEGEVKAKVWYTKSEKIALSTTKEEFTGGEETKYKIKLNNFEINLFKTLSKFEKYDTIEEEKLVKLFSNFYLPIKFIKITNKEKIEKSMTYTVDEAKQIGEQNASKQIEEELPQEYELIQKYVESTQNENLVTTEVTYEVTENIGTKEKIVF